MAFNWTGLALGAGRGLSSAVDTYGKFRAFEAARAEEQAAREERERARAEAMAQRQQEQDQAFQLDQRRLNAAVTEMGNKQRLEDQQADSREAMLQGLATSDRGVLGDALRAAALAGGGTKAFRDMDERNVATLASMATKETPEERAQRELANIIARERAQQDYSERLVSAAAGGAGNRQTPDQMAAREEVRHAETNVRGADRDFRRVVGRKPVISESRFKNPVMLQPDTAAFNAALDSWRADSTDAAQTRDDARSDLEAAQKVRNELFPVFGQRTAAAQPAPQPQLTPTNDPAAQAEFDNAAMRFRRLLDSGADPAEARAAFEATIAQIARRYGMMK